MAEAASAAAGGAANLAIQEVSFLCGVHDEVESLRDDLRSMQTFLSVEAQRGGGGNAVTADSVRRVRHAVYEAENIIDDADYRAKRNSRGKGMLGAISRYARKPMDLVARHKLGKDVLQWRRKIQDIKSSREFLDAINADRLVTASTPQPRTHRACLSRLAADPDNEAALVGLKGDVERIEEWLKDEDNTQVTVISIVAMGGAGKTTLARKVYNSAAAKEHFDAFAFVSISQQFEVLSVLKEIAMQAMGINKRVREFDKIGQGHELENMGEQELAGTLRSFLEMKSAAFPESSRLPQNLGHLILFFRGSTWNSWHADLLPTLGRLQSLVDLTLAATYQPDDAEDPDGQLTSECCQKVGVTTYKAPVMSSPAGAFPRLRHLRLYGVQVNKLRFQTGTMPKLVQLTFGFGHMTAVPDGLFDLLSLEKLNLHIMENVLPREIHELVESNGIKVIISGEDD
ncbi:hypothetical protein QOZ80_5AG0374420 [Eleusine coracana subsp. coracana]|nr:hypothetical protein QOZ80_5AG0374420 [Eleusine coracana subsp. coracana]